MPRSFNTIQVSLRPTNALESPDDLVPEIQSTLAALANVETRYEIDRDRLDQWPGSEAIKQRLLAQLENRHRRDREPIVQRLAALHQRMTELAMFSRFRTVH